MCTHSTRGVAESGDLRSLDDVARAMGIDPTTLPDPNTPTRDRHVETPEEHLDRIITEHAKRDLSDAEATLLISAIWVGPKMPTIERVREMWRMITFSRRYSVPLAALPVVVMPPWVHRTGVSSLVHRWMRAQFWTRAREALSPLPYAEWSQARRDELDALCEWQMDLHARSEARKAKRIHDIALRAQVRSKR